MSNSKSVLQQSVEKRSARRSRADIILVYWLVYLRRRILTIQLSTISSQLARPSLARFVE